MLFTLGLQSPPIFPPACLRSGRSQTGLWHVSGVGQTPLARSLSLPAGRPSRKTSGPAQHSTRGQRQRLTRTVASRWWKPWVNDSSCVCYQEERSAAFLSRALHVDERLASQTAAGDVQGLRQGHVVLRVHEQAQVGAEHSPNCCFHLQNRQENGVINLEWMNVNQLRKLTVLKCRKKNHDWQLALKVQELHDWSLLVRRSRSHHKSS